jgi:hypothetical protein
MPVRRRMGKKRQPYPDAIRALIAGAPIEDTPENREHILSAAFFHQFRELGPDIERAALQVLTEWRANRERQT